ncbi:hypothetical protein HQ533_06190 [Candidatus Woesearchaeota archaeon]|nr:hypothetical protein [Candidatus Woesearchaeota archaeon]
MLPVYKRKLLTGLMVLLVLFALIFVLALLDLKKGVPVFGTGLEYDVENVVVIILSLLSMMKVIQEIIRVEH